MRRHHNVDRNHDKKKTADVRLRSMKN